MRRRQTRMELKGLLAVSLSDFVFRSVLGDTEDLVVVLAGGKTGLVLERPELLLGDLSAELLGTVQILQRLLPLF